MYISVSDAAKKFNISRRRVQILCEQGRIEGSNMVNGVWLIPETSIKPVDRRKKHNNTEQMSLFDMSQKALSIDDVCKTLSISRATAKNWIRLGKITPDIDGQFFSQEYIEMVVSEIKSDENTKLKSRRNKKSATGKILYKDYISTEHNQRIVEEILNLNAIKNECHLLIVLANFAVQIYYQSREIEYYDNNVLRDFLSQKSQDDFHILIKELLGKTMVDLSTESSLRPALEKGMVFVKGEDSLGFAYISLRDIGQRKSAGAYYTPEKVVNELIESICDDDREFRARTFCDPCCGTGNFLLKLESNNINYKQIYGQDIDPISVHLSRINIALVDLQVSAAELQTRIIIGNSYFETFEQKFDVVLGNPPWGGDFSAEDEVKCRKLFKTAQGKSIESYDLAVEKALSMLHSNGTMAFVLPEAILSVAAHEPVRKLMIQTCSFKFVSYLGNAFSGVQCPSIILGITPDCKQNVVGCKVSKNNESFAITENRTFDESILYFNVSDKDNDCLNAINNVDNATSLKGNAKFALGIVTGNNKKYISNKKLEGYEVVLKGSDIQRYGRKKTENYIQFTPESFQQVAPTEIYRAKEKLLYRFISEVPVFAYDDCQTLSLNSCNIVIPAVPGVEIKYILAILNSSVAAYYISKKFNSVKLLRSHIEQMPIPIVPLSVQTDIIKKVDCIMNSSENIKSLYEELDNDIMKLYGLTECQISTIQAALSGKTMFLKGN